MYVIFSDASQLEPQAHCSKDLVCEIESMGEGCKQIADHRDRMHDSEQRQCDSPDDRVSPVKNLREVCSLRDVFTVSSSEDEERSDGIDSTDAKHKCVVCQVSQLYFMLT